MVGRHGNGKEAVAALQSGQNGECGCLDGLLFPPLFSLKIP